MSKEKTRIMVDIETLDILPTAVVLSIGAVEFNNQGDFLNEFHQRIDVGDCIKQGLTVGASTVMWWMDQKEEARKLITKTKGYPLGDVLSNFYDAFDWKGKEIWANGSNFDIPILENAFRACEIDIPWTFWNVRDHRTMKNLIPPAIYNDLCIEATVAHDALADAKAQAMTLARILHYINTKEILE